MNYFKKGDKVSDGKRKGVVTAAETNKSFWVRWRGDDESELMSLFEIDHVGKKHPQPTSDPLTE